MIVANHCTYVMLKVTSLVYLKQTNMPSVNHNSAFILLQCLRSLVYLLFD